MSVPVIYRLAIERFRCIKTLSLFPDKGVNLILGGGDVGKTTILDAIALLLSPTNPTTLSDTDYHARNIEAGFAIEAIVSLPTESGINQQTKASWPWDWNGTEAVVPSIDGEMKGEPVYRELGLAKDVFTDDQIISLMVEHPDLMQRPIVERGTRAILGRPTENVKELL